jgi:hypothetical protein
MKYTDPMFGEPSDEPRDLLEMLGEPAMISYGMCMWRLQEMCGLSYKEARAYMSDSRESSEQLAEAFGSSVTAVRNLARRAREKIQVSGYTLGDIFCRYGMIYNIGPVSRFK